MSTNIKQLKRDRRSVRIRSRVLGTAARPRLAVFRSNKYVYAQVIDDAVGKTLVAASNLGSKLAAKGVGEAVAKAALAKNIKQVVFDRGGYLYAGQIKAVADGARAGGLEF
jgi:large subunit ribosomal protein L18